MLITLDLKERFSRLAQSDHLSRMSAVLSDLDKSDGYSQQADFETWIAECVSELSEHKLYGAAEQTQALYCVLTAVVGLAELLQALRMGNPFQAFVQQRVEQSIEPVQCHANLDRIQRLFAGLGRFDEAWLAPICFIEPLATVTSKETTARLSLACTYDGIVNPDHMPSLPAQVNQLRTDSGFQHRVSEKFTAPALIQQVCLQVLPRETRAPSLKPVVAQCSFGMLHTNGFKVLEHVQLVDTRQLLFKLDRKQLECSEVDELALRNSWQSNSSLAEPHLILENPLLECTVQLAAAWKRVGQQFQFQVQGDASVAIQSDAIQWHANLIHKGIRMCLAVQPERNASPQWSLSHTLNAGQLPMGTPLLIREYRVPVLVSCIAPLTVGQAVLSTLPGLAGYLQMTLQVQINPDTQCIELVLSLSHSELRCHWQLADPLLGRSSGSWLLLPEARIANWNLTDG